MCLIVAVRQSKVAVLLVPSLALALSFLVVVGQVAAVAGVSNVDCCYGIVCERKGIVFKTKSIKIDKNDNYYIAFCLPLGNDSGIITRTPTYLGLFGSTYRYMYVYP